MKLNQHVLGLPAHGWIGVGLVGVAWSLNWSLNGLRTHWLFFFLWLGYCLVIDALVYVRRGTSMLSRSPLGFAALFLISVPGWWLFELINSRTQNWQYLGSEYFTSLQYFFFASLSFSTVMPAVFGTAELISTFDFIRRLRPGWRIIPNRPTLLFFFSLGFLMLVLMLAWPRNFFPFVWLSVFFMLEPINVVLGYDTLAQHTSRGDWRPVFSLWLGCLICGFFWEMWNFYAYPKWIYHVPYVDYLRVFEMPLLGYGGYLPFALELFALFHFVVGVFRLKGLHSLVQVTAEPQEKYERRPAGSAGLQKDNQQV